jgi:hypothetical protein
MQINSTGYSFVSMYQAYPSYHGASDITYNLFNEWPARNKLLIQITNSKLSKKNITNIKKKGGFIGSLINIFLIILKIRKFSKKSKKKYLIIEGASWAGFSLILMVLSKIIIRNIIVIYHAHNLEYEVRKLKNNFLISYVTFYFEKYIYQNSIATCVSNKDKNFIRKHYKSNCILFENGILEVKNEKLNNHKIKKNKFILFCGSYTYWPNKLAITNILKNKKQIEKIFPNIKFVFTGEGFPKFKDKNILALGVIKKTKLVWLIKNCLFFYAPMPRAPGTKIKILEAIYYGALTICSKPAIIGIKKTKKLKCLLVTSKTKLLKNLIKIKDKKKGGISKEFNKIYNFKNKIKEFYEKINKL